jgi:hypothetical protein
MQKYMMVGCVMGRAEGRATKTITERGFATSFYMVSQVGEYVTSPGHDRTSNYELGCL